SRSPCGDAVRVLGTFYVNDPVSHEKFFGFREDSIGNRGAVAACANDLCLVGKPQPFGGNKYAGILEFFAEGAHKSEICLQVLLWPVGVPVTVGLRGCHHQNVLHIVLLLSILNTRIGALSWCSRIRSAVLDI